MRTLLLSMLAAAAAGAQTNVVESLFQPAPLDGMWKHQMGDDPRWADPAFDDSAWPSVRMPEGAEYPGIGFSWYRFRVRLPETSREPLALMIGGFGGSHAYDLFWNGQRIGVTGEPDGGLWGLLLPTPKAFRVAGSARDAVIAIRLRTVAFPYATRLDAAHRTSWIGAPQAIHLAVEAWQGERLRRKLPTLLIAASLMMPAVFFLVLPLWRRDAPEYFWFGLWLLNSAANRVVVVFPEAFLFRTGLAANYSVVLGTTIAIVGWVGALSALFRGRVTRVVWLAAVAGAILFSAPLVFVIARGGLPEAVATLGPIALTVCLGVIYYELGWRTSRAEERAKAIHVSILAYLATNFVHFGVRSIWRTEALQDQGNAVRVVVLLLFAFAMSILMNQRSARLMGERQRLRREMESAGEVQSLLMTSRAASGDAFRIEPVYLPASEVGGDFYRILERADGSRLVLVGDVSGKGLKAAMLVSVVVGILRNEKSAAPGAVLRALNEGLSGHTGGGFVTCCCARFDRDGAVTIANAGHLAPYCDGRELELAPGLPLGIVADAEYPETIVRGAAFTFISDGVVEAENAQRELFGFDRTREISAKSAREIAEAAKAWGQNDDITVVTVRRNGA